MLPRTIRCACCNGVLRCGVSPSSQQLANKKFSSLNSEYEITFDSSTEIIEIPGDSGIMSMT